MGDESLFVESVAEVPCVNMAVKSGNAKLAKVQLVRALQAHNLRSRILIHIIRFVQSWPSKAILP
jgi:hypothetical protein